MSHIPIFWEYVTSRIFEISGLSISDYILIVGNYSGLIRGDSGNDLEKIKSRGFSDAQIKAVQKQTEKEFIPIDVMSVRFKKPLYNFKYPFMGYVLFLYDNYERGLLPFPGTITEQPCQIIEIFQLIKSMRTQLQNVKQDKKSRG